MRLLQCVGSLLVAPPSRRAVVFPPIAPSRLTSSAPPQEPHQPLGGQQFPRRSSPRVAIRAAAARGTVRRPQQVYGHGPRKLGSAVQPQDPVPGATGGGRKSCKSRWIVVGRRDGCRCMEVQNGRGNGSIPRGRRGVQCRVPLSRPSNGANESLLFAAPFITHPAPSCHALSPLCTAQDNNRLSGTFPASLNALDNLERIWGSNNMFVGSLSGQMGRLRNLTELWMARFLA